MTGGLILGCRNQQDGKIKTMIFQYSPENEDGTWKSPAAKGKSSTKPCFFWFCSTMFVLTTPKNAWWKSVWCQGTFSGFKSLYLGKKTSRGRATLPGMPPLSSQKNRDIWYKWTLYNFTNLCNYIYIYWLVVSTHLKNISQNGNLPQIGVKIKNLWNHHLVYMCT